MKTKTIMFGIISMVVMTMFASMMVLAEDDSSEPVLISANDVENVSEVSSGKIFWKEVGLWFTFNQERKMEKEMELAQLRLQQAEYATLNNNTRLAERSLDAYERLMEKVDKRNQKLNGDTNKSIERLQSMDRAILAHQQRIERLYLRLNSSNLGEEQIELIESRIERAQNATEHLQEVQNTKRERVQTRLMAENNLSEDEAGERIQERIGSNKKGK